MLDEFERRNYSQNTRRIYIRTVKDFGCHFQRSPDRLGLQHIRDYQAYLFRERKLEPVTVAQRLAAPRFLFVQVLNVLPTSANLGSGGIGTNPLAGEDAWSTM